MFTKNITRFLIAIFLTATTSNSFGDSLIGTFSGANTCGQSGIPVFRIKLDRDFPPNPSTFFRFRYATSVITFMVTNGAVWVRYGSTTFLPPPGGLVEGTGIGYTREPTPLYGPIFSEVDVVSDSNLYDDQDHIFKWTRQCFWPLFPLVLSWVFRLSHSQYFFQRGSG